LAPILKKRQELLRGLGRLKTVSKIPVPAKFGSLFYASGTKSGLVRTILLFKSSMCHPTENLLPS